ncbi:MAG: ribosome biogenesis GTPase Der [Bacteroidota bacterium]|nr:ribosome biogenesis GTPase Der [Bacteroidota bacterium]MEC8612006.1 ribosome biogenesis GTPase Der [Bacteroidota bacterium]|tara:strand:- start:3316 stop:4617 length:1302 start_codon:yes stop_codon:yes gene_type:complete
MSGIVAIVGRPNVGKSTLFNRLIESKEAIVDEVSGVTRDRHYGKSDWNGVDFSVIDTGGYLPSSDDVFQKEIDKQVILAIEEADVILFLVDVKDGLTGVDQSIADMLHKSSKETLLLVNKVDNSKLIEDSNEFYSLGFEYLFCLSSINGSGTGEFLDLLVEKLPKEDLIVSDVPKLAVIGRPNAGKSSFINSLIGKDRFIVTDVAGTTRDSLYTRYNQFGFEFDLIDTAGIRKKSKVSEDIEFYSILRSVRAIENSDICLVIFDIERGFDSQVQNIFWLAARNKKGIVILVNKWDIAEKDHTTTKSIEEEIIGKISPLTDIPIVFISALTKQRIFDAIKIAMEVNQRRENKIPTKKLNDIILPIIEQKPPPSTKGKFIKIKFCRQLPTKYPQFAFYCNLPQYIKDPYKRFLENQIRKNFNFFGVPIDIFLRKK